MIAGVLMKRYMISIQKAGVTAGVVVVLGVVVADEAVSVRWGRNYWRGGAKITGICAGISPPNCERRVAEVSCKEFSVDAGKKKIIARVTVLSEYLGWKPRRSGYCL